MAQAVTAFQAAQVVVVLWEHRTATQLRVAQLLKAHRQAIQATAQQAEADCALHSFLVVAVAVQERRVRRRQVQRQATAEQGLILIHHGLRLHQLESADFMQAAVAVVRKVQEQLVVLAALAAAVKVDSLAQAVQVQTLQ
jgi:hypothetical protein